MSINSISFVEKGFIFQKSSNILEKEKVALLFTSPNFWKN